MRESWGIEIGPSIPAAGCTPTLKGSPLVVQDESNTQHRLSTVSKCVTRVYIISCSST